ncbi:unnamed protein product [Paramecium octaurelia]|uniref:Uncharacterized protein n=1 Tax=Paramecium octaurelia TaxID=43137 RepID=A0A8S1U816_PAROT|nr:unnamed protein product [Paramecium octaurelia]
MIDMGFKLVEELYVYGIWNSLLHDQPIKDKNGTIHLKDTLFQKTSIYQNCKKGNNLEQFIQILLVSKMRILFINYKQNLQCCVRYLPQFPQKQKSSCNSSEYLDLPKSSGVQSFI